MNVGKPCAFRHVAKVSPRRCVAVAAKKDGKGFGAGSSDSSKKDKGRAGKEPKKKNVARKKSKGKQMFRAGSTSAQPLPPAEPQEQSMLQQQGLDPNQLPSLESRFKEEVDRRSGPTDETDFEDRLANLKEASTLLSKEKRIKESEKGVLAGKDAYENPPSMLETMTGEKDDPDKVNPLGNNRLTVVLGSAILGAILIISTIAPGGPVSTTGQPQLEPEEKALLERQRDTFEATLKSSPTDAGALEGAAVTYANLGDYKRSAELLGELVKLQPGDADVWRLLGETRAAVKDSGKAVEAYREAYRLKGGDLEVLKGYTGALVADGRPAEAVAVVKALSEEVKSESAVEYSARMSPIEVDLLLAKVYTQWRGHTTEALETYDQVIDEHPEDFRGYLAKGVLLKQEGRRGDADRAFLKARFFAPKELRGVVDRVATPDR